ncbi:DUF1471 domain-containing protein [Enterobacteriaceae bacterium H11S18]|uniref:DUF1471 domain-containing protein n=1 Tax=Enterobacteriaceae TaxID=543 RepID=UPI0019290BC0|nr:MULTISPECIES: DUF1471 domain-containing protein [Enterobacteriaceae]MCT4710716.1 DUF1471 domain-containing protein [Dryocola clanedunensis]
MKKIIPSLLLLTLSFSVFAAQEIRSSEMANMKEKIGTISVEKNDGTIDEAVTALSEEADKKGAAYYHITSIGMEGMGTDVRATAEIYK